MQQDPEMPRRPLLRDPTAVALLLAATLVIMSNATISPALPGLEAHFGDDPNAHLLVRLLVPAPSLSVLLAAPVAGYAADRLGRPLLLMAGLVLFVASGPAGLFLPDLASILASRLVLGIAVAMILTAQTALVGDCFTGQRRAALMGLQVSARNFGGMAFIAMAGLLAAVAPRLPFAIYGLAALYLPFVWLGVRNVPGPGLATAGQSVPGHATGASGWLLAIAGLAGLQLITAMVFFLNPTQIPFFAVSLGHDGAAATGTYLSVLMFAGGVTALFYGRIRQWIGDPGGFVTGFLLMGAGFTLLPFGGEFGILLAGGALIGAGYATVTPIFIAIALRLVPAARRGLASGIMTSSMFLGQFASPFVSMPAIRAAGYDTVFFATAIGFAAMTAAAAIVMLARTEARMADPA